MDLIEYREFCLSLEGVEEKMPFGKFARKFETTLVFYVCGHMFALCDIEDFHYASVRLTADELDTLYQTRHSFEKPINPAMKLWATITFGGDIPDSEIYAFTRRAHAIIKEKYTKPAKKQKKITNY